MKARILIFGFVALLALSNGCSTVSRSSVRTTEPTKLGVLIADADRIIVTPLGEDLSLTVSGASAKAITKDVSYMPSSGPCATDTLFAYELRFLRGEMSLATIHLCDKTFLYEGEEYRGDTGVLEALSRNFEELSSALYAPLHAQPVEATNERHQH